MSTTEMMTIESILLRLEELSIPVGLQVLAAKFLIMEKICPVRTTT